MTFLLKEMYFRNEDELTQFISQYELRFTDDKSVIDCKASQTAISQQKLLQQLANWKHSVALFRLPFTHSMHTFFAPIYSISTGISHNFRRQRIQQSFKHRAKFFVSSWFGLKLPRRAAIQLLLFNQLANVAKSFPFDAWFGLPISRLVSFRTLFCKTCARSGRNWRRNFLGSKMVSNVLNLSSRRYSW